MVLCPLRRAYTLLAPHKTGVLGAACTLTYSNSPKTVDTKGHCCTSRPHLLLPEVQRPPLAISGPRVSVQPSVIVLSIISLGLGMSRDEDRDGTAF